ncbi:hypothetical protein HSBAA_04940 [Vreelandella sulfidaeris]|uniref:Uncharacterized protein n=1 Tax=Vreelandella sulfidaeris TaxID=115553 RepID=A0A455U3X0_9GAMM|nr:hypothetical protein HSBAA_04940 [Halomonas sulfidaeris]
MLKQCLCARLGHTFKTAIAYHRLGAAAFNSATFKRTLGIAKTDPRPLGGSKLSNDATLLLSWSTSTW